MAVQLPTTQQLTSRAVQLQHNLEAAEQSLNNLTPENQLTAMEGIATFQKELSDLQNQVGIVFARTEDYEVLEVSTELSKSVTILDRLGHNQLFLLEFGPLVFQASSATQEQLNALRFRVVELANHYKDLNPANSNALVTFAAYVSGTSLQPAFIATPNQSTQAPFSVNQQASTPAPRNTQPTDTQIVTDQDREFQASLELDQFKDLERRYAAFSSLPSEPVQAFEQVIKFYKDIKSYSFGKATYTFNNAARDIDNLLKNTEDLLTKIIDTQLALETQPVQTSQPQTGLNLAFAELHDILAKFITAKAAGNNETVLKLNQQILPTFNKLSEEEKKSIFNELYSILGKALPDNQLLPSLLKQPIAMWCTSQDQRDTWKQKKQAIENIIKKSPQSAATAPTNGTGKAAEMKTRMQEAMNMQPPVVRTTQATVSRGPAPTAPQPTVPMQLGDDDFEIPMTPIESGLAQLLSILSLLREENAQGPSTLDEAADKLLTLDATDIRCVFKMSGNQETRIGQRPCFHLYFIHKNESPQLLKDDMQYGTHAYSGIYSAINQERLRATQRAIVELALAGMEDAINFEDNSNIVRFLRDLEEIKLDVKDRAGSQENAAFNLFGAFYREHVKARQSNSSLVDPHAREFEGDFGRRGFRVKPGIDSAVLLAAITQVRADLKAVWKV